MSLIMQYLCSKGTNGTSFKLIRSLEEFSNLWYVWIPINVANVVTGQPSKKTDKMLKHRKVITGQFCLHSE